MANASEEQYVTIVRFEAAREGDTGGVTPPGNNARYTGEILLQTSVKLDERNEFHFDPSYESAPYNSRLSIVDCFWTGRGVGRNLPILLIKAKLHHFYYDGVSQEEGWVMTLPKSVSGVLVHTPCAFVTMTGQERHLYQYQT